jgi:hypothetical protein
MRFRLPTFLAVVSLALAVPSARAQLPVNPTTIAWTQCVNGTVSSFINVAVLGTDSTQEILRHEQAHRAQATKALAANGGVCHVITTPEELLQLEAEAYCASDVVRVRVRHTPKAEVSALTIKRLIDQFWFYGITPERIAQVWTAVCPQ